MDRPPLFAYLFERFPSFTQTFCAREVMELQRQGTRLQLYSIRSVSAEAVQHFPQELIRQVTFLPDPDPLREEVMSWKVEGRLHPAAVLTLREWGTRPDKARLCEALWLGPRLVQAGVRHVHTHFAGIGARTCWWLRQFFGISYSFTGHANDLFCPDPDTELTVDRLIQDAAAVIAVSDYTADWLRQKHPHSASRIHRVYNGMDIPQNAPPTQDKSQPPLIVSVGRLIEKKGFTHLLDSCALLRQAGIDHRCIIAGDGPLRDALQAQIYAAGLENTCTLAGPLSQPAIQDLLQQATLFALPCVVEKDGGMDVLPTVIMEAMSAGLPCVSTHVAGVPEMIQDGKTGYLTNPGDARSAADAMASLLRAPETAARMGSAGRDLAHQLFDKQHTAASLRSILQRNTKVRLQPADCLRSPATFLRQLCISFSPAIRAPRLSRKSPVFPRA